MAGGMVNVRRYFSDFQMFINKLDEKIRKDQVQGYF